MDRPNAWGMIVGAVAVAGLASALAFLYFDFREERERERRFPPALLEKYSIGKQLGKGLTARVFSGRVRVTGEYVAIKVIRKSGRAVRESRAMDVELAILAKISHPHVIRLLDAYATESRVFLVMEHARGGELFDRIKALGHYDETAARRTFVRILAAVMHLHDQNIIHRDLKLENILLASDEDATDGQTSDLPSSLTAVHHLLSNALKRAVELLDTAPQVARGLDHGFSCDFFSLGVILHILLVGFPPYRETPFAIDWSPDFSLPGWEQVTYQAKDFVRALLRVDPSARLSGRAALAHPWLARHADELREVGLLEPLSPQSDDEGRLGVDAVSHVSCDEGEEAEVERKCRSGGHYHLGVGTGAGAGAVVSGSCSPSGELELVTPGRE